MTIYNEKQYAEFLYENQENPNLPPKAYTVWELTILAKYFRQVLKKSEKEIKNGIIKFCNLNYPSFDVDVEYEKINKVMSECYKTDLRTTVPVPITKNEWNIIQQCSTEKVQKLLFAILVVAKFNRLNPIVYIEDNEEETEFLSYEDTRLRCNTPEGELYKLMKISFANSQDKYKPYGELGKMGLNLVEIPNSNKLKRILNFGDLICEEEDILLFVEDFEKLPDYFLGLQEQKRIKHCTDCGNVFVDKSKNILQRKCQSCKKSNIENNKILETETGRRIIRCAECGKKIFVYKNSRKERLCDECIEKLKNKKELEKQETKIKTKIIVCVDCQKEVEVPLTFKRNRCDECYKIYRKNKINENAKKYYKNNT